MSSAATVTPGQVDGRANVTLSSVDGELQATFLPSLGMVGCSLLHDGEQMLELLGGPAAYEQRGSSFGIPLLYPWANRLDGWSYTVGGREVHLDPGSPLVHRDSSSGLPIHGLLAANPHWKVLDAGVEADTARLRAELEFGAVPELLGAFPFPHLLALDVSVAGDRLSIRTTLTPTGPDGVPVSFGFHPYVRLPGSSREGWTVELPVRRRMVLDERGLPTGASVEVDPAEISGPLASRVFDDCFDELDVADDGGPIVFALEDRRRRLTVEFVSGYTAAQVFAPAGADFICFEPMTAPVDALCTGDGLRIAAPGEPFQAEFAISVTSLKH